MNLHAPFLGVLLLPDRATFGRSSAVTLADGQPAAAVRWHTWSGRARFGILDADGRAELARGGKDGVFSRRYTVHTAGGATLLQLELGRWLGVGGRCTVTLPNSRTFTARRGNWSRRTFAIVDSAEQPVARIVRTGSAFALRPDSLAVELLQPALSILQAIGLAQCVRSAVEAERAAG